MALYQYKGYDKRGKPVKGVIDSPSIPDAKEKLRASGIFIESISQVSDKVYSRKGIFGYFKKQKFVYYFTRQLSFMLEASVPVVNALEGLQEQVEDESHRQVVSGIKERVKEGEPLSRALSHYPDYFNKLYINSVLAGEVSGNLNRVFKYLAEHYERNQKLAGELRASLTYPVFMVFFALAVVVFLVTFIVPSFGNLFSQFGRQLPLPTRILLGFSGFISRFWWIFVLVIVLMVFIFKRLYSGRIEFKKRLDRFVLKFPVARMFILQSFQIRFTYTMSIMLSSGVGIIEALETTGGIFKNSVFKDFITNAVEGIKKGERFSGTLSVNRLFSPAIIGMIKAGEAGDRLAEVLGLISINVEQALEEKVKGLTSILEPVIIIIIGAFVGFVVLSIMLPIFQINQVF